MLISKMRAKKSVPIKLIILQEPENALRKLTINFDKPEKLSLENLKLLTKNGNSNIGNVAKKSN